MRIRQVHLGGLDLSFVRLDGSRVLVHQGTLGVELLRGDGILLDQTLVTLEVEPRIREQRLVATKIALRRLQRRLVRTRIDLSKDIAGTNKLPFGKQNFLQGAGDLRAHGHVGQCRDRAQRGNADLDVAGRYRRNGHRHRSVLAAAPRPGAGRRRLRAVPDDQKDDREQNGHDGEHEQRDPVLPDETPRAAGRFGHTVIAIV
jgi:hypothetical protein